MPFSAQLFFAPPPRRKGNFLEIYTPASSYLGVSHLVPEIVQIKPNLLEILFSRLKVLGQQGLRIFCNSFNIIGQTENRKSFQVRDLYFLVIPLHTTPSLRQSINQSIRVKKGYPKIEDSSVMKKQTTIFYTKNVFSLSLKIINFSYYAIFLKICKS